MEDRRNVIDEFKGMDEREIIDLLDERGTGLEIAIENVERDFNMGTIVRSANAFGVRHIHIVGRRQWNKRGAMATDKYLHVHYYATVNEFSADMKVRGRAIIAVDNTPSSVSLHSAPLPRDAVMVFGGEGPGLSEDMIAEASRLVMIEQFGSTRSINVGVAAGIAMYAWIQDNVLSHEKST